MQDLKAIHSKIQDKSRERRQLMRAFQDELAQNKEYVELVEELKKLRERKKSLENYAMAQALGDASKLDTLQLEIKDQRQMLSDVALALYAEGEQVEIVDGDDIRWVPAFSVRFKKDKTETDTAKANADRAASHPERTMAAVR